MTLARNQFCDRALELLLAAALVFAALFFNPYGDLPFEETKSIWLRMLALGALPFLLLRVFGHLKENGFSLLVGAAVILILSEGVSVVFSVDPGLSWGENFCGGTVSKLIWPYFFFSWPGGGL